LADANYEEICMSGLLGRRERVFLVSVLVLTSFLSPLFFVPGAMAITWDPIEEISEDKRIEFQRYPAIAADAGKAYAVWADNGDRDYDIFLREHDGAAWQLEAELNTDDRSVDQWFPDVAAEGSNVHVVWQDPINGDWDIMYRSRSGGVLGPIEEVSVDIGIEAQQYPRAAVSSGTLHVVWQDGRDGDWDVYYRSHDGVSWSGVQELSADVGTEAQTFPCVAAGGGRVYVAWVDAGGGDTDIMMKVFNGVSWGAITEVSVDSTNEDQDEPDISYDSGKLHVVWQEVQGTDRDIFHRSWDGASFSSITEISIDSGTEFQDVPSVAAEFGKVHTVWADRGDGDWDIVYRQFDGSIWTAIQEVSGDAASENQWNPYVASDNGVVHVVWEDQGDGDQDIFYRRGFEAPPVDNTPPDVLNVLLDGMPSQTYPISSLPATVSLTATVDDSARGNSVIGGANFTIGPQNWPTSTMMTPDDFLDTPTEGFHYDVIPPITMGTWQYCVYGWDIVPNSNTIGSCATLTIIDDLAPLVTNVLIDGFAIRTIPAGTPSVFLTGTLDDSSTGNSNIIGANYTSPQKAWTNSSLMIPDDALDSPIEGFHATVDTSTLGFGSYEMCVYGWDIVPNYNTDGACATLNVAVDTQPPLVTNVLINGLSSFAYGISSTPILTLTATVDDSTTGDSNIGGANYTIGIQNWPTSAPMTPDNVLDSSVEGFNAALDGSSFSKGIHLVCVYGWDDIPNYNTIGACADLTVIDDLAPEVRDVLIDGLSLQVILEGTLNVQLTATVDDTAAGSSLIGGANYTLGPAAFPGTAMNPVNPPLDSSTEDFSTTVPTVALTSGTYSYCVYGWDDVPNSNSTNVCATLIVALETEPPAILDVFVNGMTSASFGLSSIPVLTLTASVDDAATGNSIIGGANYTIGTANWATSTLMTPDDMLDTSFEGFHASLSQPGNPGSWQYCVYGWDAIPNNNLTGSCASLTVFDDIPPDVGGVLIDGVPVRSILGGTLSVTLFANVDDSIAGGSIIAGANYTSPSQSWANSTPMIPDDSLDSIMEGFHVTVDTFSLSVGSYDLCAYGWDEAFNNNTVGSCATLTVNPPGAVDTTPPEISSVLIDGSASQSFFLSSLPPSFALTAVLDDSLTGASLIDGANRTVGPGNWPGFPMSPTDGSWDEIIEDVDLAIGTPSISGTYTYCVYGSDQEGNHNTTGECATLDILDDLPPAVSSVGLDGMAAKTIVVGTTSVTLTAFVDDGFSGGSIIGGANFTSPSLSWGNSTTMTPSVPPLDFSSEVFDFDIDTSNIPEGTYEIWVYGWDEWNNLNITPLEHAILYVVPVVVVDNPPNVDIVTIHPSEVGEDETVSVIIGVSDDGSVEEVRVEVTGPGGVVVENVTADYDASHGGYVVELSYDESGIYSVTIWARDDGGNWGSDDGTFEVLESAPAVRTNYKPLLALMFSIILILIGLLVLWKLDVDSKLKKYWFLPFAIAEGVTGGVSAATGALSIPPIAGAGLAVDIVILLMGLSIPLLLVIKRPTQAHEDGESIGGMGDDNIPENAI
jgi:hypothetical protein